MKSAESTSFTFNAKIIIKKQRGSAQEKPHVCRYEGWSEQKEVCTYYTADRGQTNGRDNMADELFDGHGDTWTGIRPMVVGIQCLSDNLDTETAHSY